jgi:hypothetical protein
VHLWVYSYTRGRWKRISYSIPVVAELTGDPIMKIKTKIKGLEVAT